MRRTGWHKTPDLSGRMEWGYTAEPTVLNWTVKAIDRNILASGIAGFILGCISSVGILLGLLLSKPDMVDVFIIGILVFSYLVITMGMEKPSSSTEPPKSAWKFVSGRIFPIWCLPSSRFSPLLWLASF